MTAQRMACVVKLLVTALLLLTVPTLRAEDEVRSPGIVPIDAKSAEGHQQLWAKHLKSKVEITNSIDMKLRLIPAGEFMMGLPDSEKEGPEVEAGERPQHRVRITKPFYLGKFEVTRGEFLKFVVATKYKTESEKSKEGGWGYTGNVEEGLTTFSPKYSWRNTGFKQTDDHPVVNVSWNDAVEFCHWLSKEEGKTYRLPTEAEWEWACRAGTKERWNCGNKETDLQGNANLDVPDRTQAASVAGC